VVVIINGRSCVHCAHTTTFSCSVMHDVLLAYTLHFGDVVRCIRPHEAQTANVLKIKKHITLLYCHHIAHQLLGLEKPRFLGEFLGF